MSKFDNVVAIIENVNEARAEFERLLADTLSGAIGLLGMLIPSYWAYHHLHSVMNVGKVTSGIIGLTMAMLEFVILNRYFELLQFRRRYAESRTRGSVSPLVPLGALLFYFFAAFMVNGFLSFFDAIMTVDGQTLNEAMALLVNSILDGDRGYYISVLSPAIVKTLVVLSTSSLSIPGAMITAIGFLHQDFVASKTRAKKAESKPRKRREQPRSSDEPPPPSDNSGGVNFDEYIKLLRENPDISPTEAAKKLGVSRPTIYKYKKQYEEEYTNDTSE